jgi:hypothetical protein
MTVQWRRIPLLRTTPKRSPNVSVSDVSDSDHMQSPKAPQGRRKYAPRIHPSSRSVKEEPPGADVSIEFRRCAVFDPLSEDSVVLRDYVITIGSKNCSPSNEKLKICLLRRVMTIKPRSVRHWTIQWSGVPFRQLVESDCRIITVTYSRQSWLANCRSCLPEYRETEDHGGVARRDWDAAPRWPCRAKVAHTGGQPMLPRPTVA